MELKSICKSVCEVVLETGSFIRRERKNFSVSSVEYKGANDLVSYVDKTAEQRIIEGLSSLLPEAGFLAEENTFSKKGHEYNWIIDPLDGTTNFVHGVPCFCISVALMKKEKVVIGVIYEINLDECFYAYKGGGAYLNDKRITVSETAILKKSLLATGFP